MDLREHHSVRSSIVLLANGASLPVKSGRVDVDSRRPTRRTCQAEIIDLDQALQDAVTPYGIEAAITQTLTWDTGESQTYPLGVFVLSSPEFDEDSTGITVSLDGEDRSRRVARAGRTAPVNLLKTTLLTDAIDALISPTLPTVSTVTTDGADPAIGSILTFIESPDADSWADAVNLASAFGYDLFFDVAGEPVLRPYPDVVRLTNPDWVDPPVIKRRKSGGDEGVYSGVVAVAYSTTGAPLRAELWDTNPASPTYVYGPFGFVPRWIEIEVPTTYDALLTTARGVFAKSTGASQSVEWEQIPNPGYDAWDVVSQAMPNLGVDRANLIVDSVSVPLGLGSQTVRARDGRWLV